MTKTEWSALELNHVPLIVSRKNKRSFLRWADKNGWQPYDSLDRWVNLKQGRKLASALSVYQLFIKEQNTK